MSPGVEGEQMAFSSPEAVGSPRHGSNFRGAQDVRGALAARGFALGFPAVELSLRFVPVCLHPGFGWGPAPPVRGVRLVPVSAGLSGAERPRWKQLLEGKAVTMKRGRII